MYIGAQAKLGCNSDQFTNFIDFSIGGLHGDTFTPYLFVIVVDFVTRVALTDQFLGLTITRVVSRALQNM
jgi:hypothetical protein